MHLAVSRRLIDHIAMYVVVASCRKIALYTAVSAGLVKGINEVEDMLKYNIAQARLNERGNYGEHVL